MGVDVRNVNDAAGKPLFKEMIELARKQGSGTVDYVWRNPATNAVEQKHTLIQRVDDVLLGVGYYTRPEGTRRVCDGSVNGAGGPGSIEYPRCRSASS